MLDSQQRLCSEGTRSSTVGRHNGRKRLRLINNKLGARQTLFPKWTHKGFVIYGLTLCC